MKQKFVILKSDDQKEFKIEEFAELEKDIMSLMCKEKYDSKDIKSAISAGKEALISLLRTKNFFPTSLWIGTIADAVIDLHGNKQEYSAEVLFDDKKDKVKAKEVHIEIEPLEDEIDEVDDSEPDEFDQLIDDNDKIKDGVIPIKIDEFENEDREEDL
ncbi:MAG: hypothetical protein MUP22_10665 [Desulfobacterales bacterium]|nr:hypothetical protein [Desulfobacterales bacterium]